MSNPVAQSPLLSAVRAFLLAILPAGVEVVRGQDNRVPEPSAADYVVMTPLGRARLATNTTTYTDTQREDVTPWRVTVQLDVHGPNSNDNATTIAGLWRSDFACDQLEAAVPGIDPLDAKDPVQAPFVNGEGEFEDRWTVDVALQANPSILTAQDFATSLAVNEIVAVDVELSP